MKYTPTEELLATPEADRIRWAEALESGKYEQIRGTLHVIGKGNCCLGVGERISGTTVFSMLGVDLPSDIRRGARFMLGDRLPQRIRAATCSGGQTWDFTELNDELYFTFPEIAQLLRGNEVVK